MVAWWDKLIAACCCGAFAVLPAASALSPRIASAQSLDPSLSWANALIAQTDPGRIKPNQTRVSDHFGPEPYTSRRWWDHALAANGRRLLTAGSGSFWVYDRAHGIAASSEGGDAQGDRILYADPPPQALPARDLSRMVSVRGLRLGISSSLAARYLGVPPTAVRRISPHRSILYARTNRRCNPYLCAHDATIFFRDDRAVAISLFDLGP
ncbi:MAG TPA: hypothetical protein VE591_12605 [Candidatus Acidoferrum sp.]|nr:hypothetical protein [Candidatus Acidoferrum sp.]